MEIPTCISWVLQKELTYEIVAAVKFKIYRIDGLETPTRVDIAVLGLKFVGQAGTVKT